MIRLGYDAEAAELTRRVSGAVQHAGLREYYDPFTGKGMGAKEFSWSALVMELVDPDRGAASSHLPPASAG
jgi:hypothetical protein